MRQVGPVLLLATSLAMGFSAPGRADVAPEPDPPVPQPDPVPPVPTELSVADRAWVALLAGSWTGTLDVGGQQLLLNMTFTIDSATTGTITAVTEVQQNTTTATLQVLDVVGDSLRLAGSGSDSIGVIWFADSNQLVLLAGAPITLTRVGPPQPPLAVSAEALALLPAITGSWQVVTSGHPEEPVTAQVTVLDPAIGRFEIDVTGRTPLAGRIVASEGSILYVRADTQQGPPAMFTILSESSLLYQEPDDDALRTWTRLP